MSSRSTRAGKGLIRFVRRPEVNTVLAPVAFFVILVTLWSLALWAFEVDKIVVPSPTAVVSAFWENAGTLFRETGLTMLESVAGFVLGSAFAYLLAIAFVHSPLMQKAIYPYAVALKSTPLIAIAPLLVIWFGNGILSKIVMSALVAFFPVLVNSTNGLTAVDPEALALMRSLSATRMQILTRIRIPNSLGYVFAALKIASSLAVVGAVIGEFTGATQGIGHVITTSSYYLQTDLMFAAIVMISLGGILFFGLIAYLEQRVAYWQSGEA